MEDNGALSNPRARVEFDRLVDLCSRLRQEAADNPRRPRAVPPRLSPVLKLVSLVLERADGPMRAREIHVAAEELAGTPLRWASVRQALSAGVPAESPRFQRVRHGVYQAALAARDGPSVTTQRARTEMPTSTATRLVLQPSEPRPRSRTTTPSSGPTHAKPCCHELALQREGRGCRLASSSPMSAE